MKDVWVHDIVNGLTIAIAHAEILSEQRPEVAEPVRRLVADIDKAREAFVNAVMPLLRNEGRGSVG